MNNGFSSSLSFHYSPWKGYCLWGEWVDPFPLPLQLSLSFDWILDSRRSTYFVPPPGLGKLGLSPEFLNWSSLTNKGRRMLLKVESSTLLLSYTGKHQGLAHTPIRPNWSIIRTPDSLLTHPVSKWLTHRKELDFLLELLSRQGSKLIE